MCGTVRCGFGSSKVMQGEVGSGNERCGLRYVDVSQGMSWIGLVWLLASTGGVMCVMDW